MDFDKNSAENWRVDILGDEILVINSNFGIAEYGKRKTSFTDANFKKVFVKLVTD